ncbi:MAG: ATP-binding protein [bacterium]
MFDRKIKNKLLQTANSFQVVAIFGPRQSGKTTLSKLAFPGYIYKNLEDPTEREFAVSDARSFLKDADKGMIIDEIQNVPELFSYIQVMVDSNRNAKFIITGSQNYLLLEKISQSLAGRVYLLRLLPFSIDEIKSKYYPANYHDFIFRGFFPPIYDRELSVSDWMPSYIQTYLERDVRQIKNITDLNVFQKFLQLCSGRIGQLVNTSSLGNDIGVSDKTIKSWLTVLETSFIVYLLKPYYNNFNKRIIKSPKMFFIDTGLASSFLNIKNSEQAESHFLKGGLFENLILLEVLKFFVNKGENPQLYFWRDNHGNEIDLIFEMNNVTYAIEIKAGGTISNTFFKGLDYFEKITAGSPLKKIIIYGGDQFQERKAGFVIPWNQLEKMFEIF